MKVVVISDTHTMGASRPIPTGAWPFIEVADHILHAGDVCDVTVLDELATFAPVSVVMGNCDGMDIRDRGAADELEIRLEEVPLAMVHDSGPSSGRRERLRKRYPGARVVVFGHSHLPVNEDDGGLLLFNPGSPTWKRRAPVETIGMLWIDGAEVEGEIIPV